MGVFRLVYGVGLTKKVVVFEFVFVFRKKRKKVEMFEVGVVFSLMMEEEV